MPVSGEGTAERRLLRDLMHAALVDEDGATRSEEDAVARHRPPLGEQVAVVARAKANFAIQAISSRVGRVVTKRATQG
jgi:hypothetical protein